MFLPGQLFLNDLACHKYSRFSVIKPQSSPGSLLCEVVAGLSTTGTDRFDRKITHLVSRPRLAELRGEPTAGCSSWGYVLPGWLNHRPRV